MSSDVIAFIFARAGSKGLPNKNLRRLGGVPLVGRAVLAAKECRYVDRVVVSTDSPQVAEAAEEFGAEVPWLRPADLATDATPEIEAWRHAIANFDGAGSETTFRTFLSVPATAPLRTAGDLDKCIDLFQEGDCDIVVTGTPASRHPSFNMLTIDARGFARLPMAPSSRIARRQDAPEMWDMTTVAYVTTPRYILSAQNLLAGRVRLVEIPKERAVDIDDDVDLAIAECLLARREEAESR